MIHTHVKSRGFFSWFLIQFYDAYFTLFVFFDFLSLLLLLLFLKILSLDTLQIRRAWQTKKNSWKEYFFRFENKQREILREINKFFFPRNNHHHYDDDWKWMTIISWREKKERKENRFLMTFLSLFDSLILWYHTIDIQLMMIKKKRKCVLLLLLLELQQCFFSSFSEGVDDRQIYRSIDCSIWRRKRKKERNPIVLNL